MAEGSGTSNFLIEVQFNGESVQVLVTPDIVESLNSTDPSVQKQTRLLIEESVRQSRSRPSDDASVGDQCHRTTQSCASNGDCEASSKCNNNGGIAPKNWSTDEAKALCSIRLAKEEEFTDANNHNTLWIGISKELATLNIYATPTQCNNKFKTLKRDYRSCKDKNSLSGSDAKFCKFYEELDNVYGTKAGTKPLFTLSSFTKENVQESSTTPSKEERKGTKRRATRSPPNNQVIEFMKDYQDRQDTAENKRLKLIEKMHEDRISLMNRFIDALGSKKE